MARPITVLLLAPGGRTTRRFELTLARLVVLGLAVVVLLATSLWLGWGIGVLSASTG